MEEPKSGSGATTHTVRLSNPQKVLATVVEGVGHTLESCYHKGKKCNKCKIVGLLARVCKRKRVTRQGIKSSKGSCYHCEGCRTLIGKLLSQGKEMQQMWNSRPFSKGM